jgi:hypothetical protein
VLEDGLGGGGAKDDGDDAPGAPAALVQVRRSLWNVRWRSSAQGRGRRGQRLGTGSGAAGRGAASGSAGEGGAGTTPGRTGALGAKTPKSQTRLALPNPALLAASEAEKALEHSHEVRFFGR